MKDGTIVDTDSNSSKLFGYKEQEMIGLTVWSLTTEPYQAMEPMMNALLHRDAATNWGTSRAYEGKRKDNSIFPMQISFSSIGEEVFMASVDTIDRVTSSLTINNEGKIVFATNEHEIFGFQSAQILQHQFGELVCANDAGTPLSIDALLNLSTEDELEVSGIDKSGNYLPLLLRVAEIINLGNTKLFRINLEKIDYSNEVCLVVDLSETILSCSQHFVKPLYGGDASSLIGQKMSQLFREESVQYTNTAKHEEGERSSKRRRNSNIPFRFLENCRSWEENNIYQYLSQMRRKDGSIASVRIRVLPFSKDGTKLFSVRICRQVGPLKLVSTERKEKLLGNQYKVTEVIGEGAFGKVKMGEDTKTHQKVAIKILNLKMMKPSDVESAHREIKILKQIVHKNIVKLLDVFETENRLYLVQEHAGVDLHTYVMQHSKLSETETKNIFVQLCDAVEYCHALGIVHRDIKPNNILLDDGGVARLIDFGVSNFASEDEMRGTYCGTTACAPPEMILGKKYQGTKVDVWTMGVMLYFMLTGNMPFPDIASILNAQFVPPPGVSENCIDVLTKMLELDVDKRAKLSEIITHPWITKSTFVLDGKLEETNSDSSKDRESNVQ